MEIKFLVDIFWFLRIPILLLIYLITSIKRNPIYLIALLFYQSASVLFFLDTQEDFVYGTYCSMLFKLFLLFLIFSLVTRNNYKAVIAASVPFFVIYLYVIEFVIASLGDNYLIWIVNALFTSIIGGVAIINYVNEPAQKNYWLLISAILFIVQIGAFFINKFYIRNEGIYQMVIFTYGISHFAFYKFLILKEKSDKKYFKEIEK